jgi:hypothetical protein
MSNRILNTDYMIADTIMANANLHYITFFVFQAMFITLGVGSIIFLKFLFRKLMSIKFKKSIKTNQSI